MSIMKMAVLCIIILGVCGCDNSSQSPGKDTDNSKTSSKKKISKTELVRKKLTEGKIGSALFSADSEKTPEMLEILLEQVDKQSEWKSKNNQRKLIQILCEWPEQQEMILDKLVAQIDDLKEMHTLVPIVKAIGDFKQKKHAKVLLQFIKDNDWRIPFAAALTSLEQISDPEQVSALKSILEMDPEKTADPSPKSKYPPLHNGKTRIRIVNLLEKHGKAREITPTLIKELNSSVDWRVLERVSEILGEIGTDETVEALIAKYNSSRGNKRILKGLLLASNSKARSYHEKALGGRDKTMCLMAAKALAESATPGDAKLVSKYLKQDDPIIRMRMLQALKKTGGSPDLKDLGEQWITSGRPRSALLLAEAIGNKQLASKAGLILEKNRKIAIHPFKYSKYLGKRHKEIQQELPDALVTQNREWIAYTEEDRRRLLILMLENKTVRMAGDPAERILLTKGYAETVFGIKVGDSVDKVWELHGPSHVPHYTYRYHIIDNNGEKTDVWYSISSNKVRDITISNLE